MPNKKAINLINAIKNSHPDMIELYTKGRCYDFFLILKSVFDDAEAWYDGSHVFVNIDGSLYDINGYHKEIKGLVKLDHRVGDRPHRWGSRDKRRFVLTESSYD